MRIHVGKPEMVIRVIWLNTFVQNSEYLMFLISLTTGRIVLEHVYKYCFINCALNPENPFDIFGDPLIDFDIPWGN